MSRDVMRRCIAGHAEIVYVARYSFSNVPGRHWGRLLLGRRILSKLFRLSFFAAVIIFGWRLAAQTSAALNVEVTDPRGAAIQGVRVSMTNADTSVRRETVPGDSGLYEFPLLEHGPSPSTVRTT